MDDSVKLKGIVHGEKLDRNGNLVKEFNKRNNIDFRFDERYENKICIDANVMTSSILNEELKRLLIDLKGGDLPFTTEAFKKECKGNIKQIKKCSNTDTEREFNQFEKEIGLKYLACKEEYHEEGRKLFSQVINSGMKIKKKSTFLMDCVNLITIKNNKVSVLFSNDEELIKVCRKFVKSIEVVQVKQESNNKTIKDFFRYYQKRKSKR